MSKIKSNKFDDTRIIQFNMKIRDNDENINTHTFIVT